MRGQKDFTDFDDKKWEKMKEAIRNSKLRDILSEDQLSCILGQVTSYGNEAPDEGMQGSTTRQTLYFLYLMTDAGNGYIKAHRNACDATLGNIHTHGDQSFLTPHHFRALRASDEDFHGGDTEYPLATHLYDGGKIIELISFMLRYALGPKAETMDEYFYLELFRCCMCLLYEYGSGNYDLSDEQLAELCDLLIFALLSQPYHKREYGDTSLCVEVELEIAPPIATLLNATARERFEKAVGTKLSHLVDFDLNCVRDLDESEKARFACLLCHNIEMIYDLVGGPSYEHLLRDLKATKNLRHSVFITDVILYEYQVLDSLLVSSLSELKPYFALNREQKYEAAELFNKSLILFASACLKSLLYYREFDLSGLPDADPEIGQKEEDRKYWRMWGKRVNMEWLMLSLICLAKYNAEEVSSGMSALDCIKCILSAHMYCLYSVPRVDWLEAAKLAQFKVLSLDECAKTFNYGVLLVATADALLPQFENGDEELLDEIWLDILSLFRPFEGLDRFKEPSFIDPNTQRYVYDDELNPREGLASEILTKIYIYEKASMN